MPGFSIRKHQFTEVFAQVQPQRRILAIAVVIQGNWATPQGDSKTHHHLGVHVFQTCKIAELQSHRLESRFQKFSEARKCVTVCDSLHELSSRLYESVKAKSVSVKTPGC